MNEITNPYKILVAGVGGQGVVFLTKLIVKAALLCDLPVATSEIHGLAQRGGSVSAGITLGDNSFGYIESGGIDLLLGLEPLEAQRCITYLNKNSSAVIDHFRILPFAVNAGMASYPDVHSFIAYLSKHIEKVIYIHEDKSNIKPIQRNLLVLANACAHTDFPISAEFIEKAISSISKKDMAEESLKVFRSIEKEKQFFE